MRGSRVFGALDDRGRPFKFLRGVTRRSIFPIFAVLVVTAAFAPAITAGASTTRVNASPSRFYVGGIMRVGQRLSSPSHIFSAVLESDGQFEVLKHNTVVWRSSSGSGLNSVINRESNGDITITAPHESANVSGAKQNLKPSYLTVQNDGDMALVSKFGVTLWQSGLRAHTSGSTVTPYSRGALYGGSNPSVVCYTCEAADITGTAPPSDTLDSGTDVDNVTGDFSTSNSLFDAPSIGGDLSLSLGYDAELAQSDLQNGTAVGPFGVGWNSNYSDSITPGGDEYDNPTVTVNQGNGSQVTFTQSENYGESTFCQIAGQPTSSVFPGDYPTTNKYTLSSSDYQFCALDSVQGQLSEVTSSGYTYQQSGGQVIEDFGWTGQLEQVTTAAASSGTPSAGLVFYGASAGQSLIDGVTVTNACPTSANYGCTVIYNSDHSDIVEVKNIGGQIGEVIDPSGSIYTLTYDSDKNLVSIATPNPSGSSTASAWTYVYTESAGNPDTSDLEEIYDPDAVSPSGFVSGAAHSTSITYDDYSTTTPGMVSSLTDGTGATTTYSYSEECSTGDCVAAGQSQTTTITYPGEVPCPSGASGCTPTAQSPVEIDQYSGGLETSTSLGSSTNGDENETWSYSWNLGNGVANSSEVITYPATLNVANNSAYVPPSATIISDPAGNVISTTNALGDVSTSVYNDQGGNNLPELLWSFPGPSSNGATSPPSGAWVYTYNSFGQVLTATDPLGNATTYAYYPNYSLLCYVAPPSLSASMGTPPACSSSSTSIDTGAVGAPVGSTTYSYDAAGNVVSSTIDNGDSGASADVQTTTATYDVMGNELSSIPAAGQSWSGSGNNPFGTFTTYSAADLPVTVTPPGQGATTTTYDADGNVVGTQSPDAYVTTVFDGDDRACYSVTAASAVSGLSCASALQAGATATTFVSGSTAVSTVIDANGNTTSNYYADLAYPDSPTEVVDAAGTEISYSAYDDYGNVCVAGSVQPTLGATQCAVVSGDTEASFNALGDETSITAPDGNVTTNFYENSSFPTLETRTVSALSKTTSYLYDADGRLVTTVNPDGTGVSTVYDADGQVCNKELTIKTYACGQGPSAAGTTLYTYNNAQDLASMSDNTGNPTVPNAWSQTSNYSYVAGQLTNETDGNAKTLTYLYNYAGQVACEGYPVGSSVSCGTLTSPGTGSTTNTIVTKTYDTSGRLASVKDWLGNTTSYTYADANYPNTVTKITYPSGTGVSATYGHDADGNVTSLSAGSNITDGWTYNNDEQLKTTTINGATSATVAYSANHQITAAANMATSTSNDTYTVASNGEIEADAAPGGSTVNYSYNAGDELCNSSTSSTSCSTPASTSTRFAYASNGERTSATTYSGGTAGSATYYAWNAYGQLCNVAGTATACGSTPSSGASYQYNGDGERTITTTPTSTTDSTWDNVSSVSIPINLNDATTTSSGTTNTSYIYGNLLFGGTAPIEQVTGSTATFLVANQTGVQGVYGSSGSSVELAIYSTYGNQTISSGSKVTPFGFQGSYTDSTGLIYLINRYYDPATDQFISVDPDIALTNQPYLFTGDNPLNAEDPLGEGPFGQALMCIAFGWMTCSSVDATFVQAQSSHVNQATTQYAQQIETEGDEDAENYASSIQNSRMTILEGSFHSDLRGKSREKEGMEDEERAAREGESTLDEVELYEEGERLYESGSAEITASELTLTIVENEMEVTAQRLEYYLGDLQTDAFYGSLVSPSEGISTPAEIDSMGDYSDVGGEIGPAAPAGG